MARNAGAGDATDAVLLELLKNAAAAHGEHEKNDLGGVYDEEWPEWYAAHMTRALAERGLTIAPDEGA